MLLLLCFVTLSGSNHTGKDVGHHIRTGDRAYATYDNTAALTAYQAAVQMDSTNYAATWKLARAHVDVGERVSDKKQRKKHFEKAADYARYAAVLAPDSVQGHVFLAVALGNLALNVGAKQRVRLAKDIKASADRALTIAPDNPIAWHVLGRWHREVATVSWLERRFAGLLFGGVPADASLEKSIYCFEQAVRFRPDFIHHHYELAVTLEKSKNFPKAIEHYERVLRLPGSDADDSIHKKNASERLKKLR
jgi:tetratricopeptide (TPR) repeat protein